MVSGKLIRSAVFATAFAVTVGRVAPASLLAQADTSTTASTITGVVRDSSGGAIPGATVRVPMSGSPAIAELSA